MGAICSGALPSPPEIDISPEDIASACADALSGIPQTIAENIANFKAEIAKCEDKFDVPETTLVLTKESDEDAIRIAAVTAAFATSARDAIKV